MKLKRRGSTFHFRMRVPARFAAVEPKAEIARTLRTDSEAEAQRIADEMERDLIAAWEAKALRGEAVDVATYDQVRDRARGMGSAENYWQEALHRFEVVIDASELSRREVSRRSGNGPNFVSQMMSSGRQPSYGKLLSVLDSFSRPDQLYVLTGLRFDAADLDMLDKVSKMDAGSKSAFLTFLETLVSPERAPEPNAT